MSNIKKTLLNESEIKSHIEFQTNNYFEYISTLILLFYDYNVEFTIIKKAKILVASLLRNDKELSKFLLSNKKYDLPVIVKCCDILDSKRLLKQLNEKTKNIHDKKMLSKHKSKISNLQKLNEGLDMSLSKSKINFIKSNWIQKIPKNDLEILALIYPVSYWKKLIDILHLKSSDLQLQWFTSYVCNKEYPDDSIISSSIIINVNNFKNIIEKYKIPYDYLRINHKQLLSYENKNIVFDYSPLNNILRHWDDFMSDENSQKIINRLQSSETFDIPYGELVKRIQILNEKSNNDELVKCLLNIAENKLSIYDSFIEQPVVVFGDASASMDVAIKTSSIITSILCKISNAKMHLFRNEDEYIENPPRNVSEVLELSKNFSAHSATAPGASLYKYLQNKEIVKTFVLVTDEEENTNYNGEWINSVTLEDSFAGLFKQYYEQVYPAKLVFVSFLKSGKEGQMVTALKNLIPGIENNIIQFILNDKKPDLRKLDVLLNTLSMETEVFNIKCNKLKKELEKINNLSDVFDKENISRLLKGQSINCANNNEDNDNNLNLQDTNIVISI